MARESDRLQLQIRVLLGKTIPQAAHLPVMPVWVGLESLLAEGVDVGLENVLIDRSRKDVASSAEVGQSHQAPAPNVWVQAGGAP